MCQMWIGCLHQCRGNGESWLNSIAFELLLCVGFLIMRQCLDAIIWKVLDLLFVQVDIIMISWEMSLKFLNRI